MKLSDNKILLDSVRIPSFVSSAVNVDRSGSLGKGSAKSLSITSSSPGSSTTPAALLRLRSTSGTVRKTMELSTVVAPPPPPAMILTSGASGRISALFSLRALRSLMMLVNAFFLLLLVPFRGRKPSSEKFSDEDKQRGTAVRVPAAAIVHWKSASSAAAAVPATVVDHDVAARRALAKIRVRNDEDDRNSLRQCSIFANARGETLFTQTWTPVSVEIRGIVILMHGLNEHSGRYNTFAKQLNANGFKVYGMDWIGHGGSDGLHGFVPSLDFAVADLKSYIEKVRAENPGLPCFCFGHSTGGAIIIKAMIDPKVETCIDSVVLTSPAVGVQPTHPIFMFLAPLISFLLPRYQLSAANKTGMPVSRDPAALVAKYSDPLVYTGAIRARTGYEILRITTYLQQNLRKLKVPFLVLHGTADTVTDPKASQKLYNEASSTDKTIKLYEGLLHDLLFEPEREAVSEHIIGWLKSRV